MPPEPGSFGGGTGGSMAGQTFSSVEGRDRKSITENLMTLLNDRMSSSVGPEQQGTGNVLYALPQFELSAGFDESR